MDWCEELLGFTPAEPWRLCALLLLPLWWLRSRPAHGQAVLFAPLASYGDRLAPKSWRTRLQGLPRLLLLATLCCTILAWSRPVSSELLPRSSDGCDILLVLDRSASMTARDLSANETRLECAIRAARAFIAARPHDRIGLVTFARFTDLVCPPTLDHAALNRLLESVQPASAEGSEDATGLGAAAAYAVELLAQTPGTRSVVLLSDGVETVVEGQRTGALTPLAAGQLARERGVKLHVITATPERDTEQAAAVVAESMARLSGGQFFTARDEASLRATFAAIDAAEKTRFHEPRWRVRERGHSFILAALLCLLCSELLACGPLRSLP
jgi:Ca-activated chloride channel family protein